ncbi:MAG: DUF4126 domain-containing protein [Flavobacteriaceae bacterium]|nr:MAG: DUF4126 domain-containing protein [Flavobacteriaceae bacterium]
MAHFGLDITHEFSWVGSPAAMISLGIATVVEAVAYLLPFVDNLMDTIAVPLATMAGTLLMAGSLMDLEPVMKWGLAIIAGGGTAGAIKGAAATGRASSTLVSGGIMNPFLSFLGTLFSGIITMLTIYSPIIGVILAVGCLLFLFTLIRKFKKMIFSQNTSNENVARL